MCTWTFCADCFPVSFSPDACAWAVFTSTRRGRVLPRVRCETSTPKVSFYIGFSCPVDDTPTSVIFCFPSCPQRSHGQPSEVFYVRNLLFPSGRVFSSTHFSLGVPSASHGRVHFRPGTFFGICFSCPAEDTLLRVHQSAVDSDLVSYTFSSLCSRLVEGSVLLQCSGSLDRVALVSESWASQPSLWNG